MNHLAFKFLNYFKIYSNNFIIFNITTCILIHHLVLIFRIIIIIISSQYTIIIDLTNLLNQELCIHLKFKEV